MGPDPAGKIQIKMLRQVAGPKDLDLTHFHLEDFQGFQDPNLED
jgi:hypothetical protein